jgi:cell surface protein SprA
MKRLLSFLYLVFLSLGVLLADPIRDMLGRVLPNNGDANKFVWNVTNSETQQFTISCDGTRVTVKGSDYIAVATGINWYLQHYAGIDISWVNLMSTKLEYRRTRQITLGFANSQISEMYRKEWVIGVGYKFAQLPLNIRTSSGSNRFKSDLDLRADLVIDDDKTIIREIENLYDQISAGQRSFSIKSTADYRLSQRFKVQLYYNHQITNPIISTSYRTSNIKFGFSITMSLD